MGLQRRLAAAAAAAAAQPPSPQRTAQSTAGESPADSTTESLLQGLFQMKLSDPATAAHGTAEANSPAEQSAPDQSAGAGISSQLSLTALSIADAEQV